MADSGFSTEANSNTSPRSSRFETTPAGANPLDLAKLEANLAGIHPLDPMHPIQQQQHQQQQQQHQQLQQQQQQHQHPLAEKGKLGWNSSRIQWRRYRIPSRS